MFKPLPNIFVGNDTFVYAGPYALTKADGLTFLFTLTPEPQKSPKFPPVAKNIDLNVGFCINIGAANTFIIIVSGIPPAAYICVAAPSISSNVKEPFAVPEESTPVPPVAYEEAKWSITLYALYSLCLARANPACLNI